LDVRPLIEVAYAGIAKVGGGVFDIDDLYGRDHIWSLSLGIRLGAGAPMHRMGRYGAVEETMTTMHHHEEMAQ
jgi:hypothetical protein